MKEKVLGSCAVSLGGEYVDLDLELVPGNGEGDGMVIEAGSEVAIIPPVSSG